MLILFCFMVNAWTAILLSGSGVSELTELTDKSIKDSYSRRDGYTNFV